MYEKLRKRLNASITDCFHLLQVWYSERLYYYPSNEYTSTAWFGHDNSLLENQIKLCTKALHRCCICLDARAPRAFGLCRIPLFKDGTLGIPRFDVKLISASPFKTNFMERTFNAQGLSTASFNLP